MPARKAVLKAEGGEIHGQGKGTAVVTATLSPSARGTRVQVVTVLSVDGRLAQFAKGVIAAVSRNLIAEFAENLELTVPAAPNATTAGPVVGTETAEGADKAPAEASPRR
jgi:carbon monoxide dehydrogenase subunit G